MIGQFKPAHFLWTGDAVYIKSNNASDLRPAFQNLTDNPFYKRFTHTENSPKNKAAFHQVRLSIYSMHT